jgi:hypothetical protein
MSMTRKTTKLEKSWTFWLTSRERLHHSSLALGGFIGAGEKDVAVNFNAVKKTTKDNKVYLTMDTTKDALKSAAGFKYDRNKTTWVPDNSK